MEVPKTLVDNMQYRIDLIAQAEKDPVIQQILMKRSAADPIFWINSFGYTYDPRLSMPNIPFLTYKYQDDYILDVIKCIEEWQDNITEKSRDMWFSWMIVMIAVRWFIFHGWSGLMWSYKQEYVDNKWDMDSLFEKMRYVIDMLPLWMKPQDLTQKYMSISSKSLNAEIGGDAGENFGTWGRRKWVFMDEFAIWQNAEKAFRKTRDITKCRIIWWTPEGRFNLYGKIMTNHVDYKHLAIKKFRLHWSLHPKKTPSWYENEKNNRTKLEIAQELDISYDNSVSGAVYKDFLQVCKFGKYEYDYNLPLYTSWDFWLDTNAIIFVQKDHKTNANYKIRSVKRVGWDIRKFAAFVTGKPTQWFVYDEEDLVEIDKSKAYKYTSHFWDPYNLESEHTSWWKSSIAKELEEFGIYFSNREDMRKWTVEERIRKTTLALPRFFVEEDDVDYIHDLVNAKYPKIKEWSEWTQERTKPIHDTTSHYRTATEYYFDNEPMLPTRERREQNQVIKKWDPIHGKMREIQKWINNQSPFSQGKWSK